MKTPSQGLAFSALGDTTHHSPITVQAALGVCRKLPSSTNAAVTLLPRLVQAKHVLMLSKPSQGV